MQLVIAEKPSVARDLARVLGATRRAEGSLEGDGYVVTWCIGHLVELDEPASYDPAWKPWRADTLPMLPAQFRLRPARSGLSQWKVVRALLRDPRFEAVINACDAGREGELIFRWCHQLAGSRLAVRRLWVSSLTDTAIRAGFARLQPGARYEPLADAARCRAESDWLVGLNATRAFTIRQRRGGEGVLYSIGRVQTPTLALIVAREKAIRAFVARDYWEVHARFAPAGAEVFAARWLWSGRSAFGAKEPAQAVCDRARDATARGPKPVVERVQMKRQRVPPPLLFDLTSLQRTANARYGFSAQRTLDLAQSLYETHKLLTYPRTDSRYLSGDIHATLDDVFAALQGYGDVAPFASRLRAHPPGKVPRVFQDAKVSDHHAIIPTARKVDVARLDRDHQRVYELVVRRFLGVFYPDAEFELTSAVVRVGAADGAVVEAPPPEVREPSDEPAVTSEERFLTAAPPPPDRFVAQGRVRKVAGWQEVAGLDDDARGLPSLPALREGDALDGRYAVETKRTQAPRRYSEATLLAAMESAGREIEDEELRAAMRDSGLGTPATRASILETLLTRGYMLREGKSLVATPLGEGLIDALPVDALRSAELTGQWEARLARMARGEESRARFMADIAAFVQQAVGELRVAPQVAAAANVAPTPRRGREASPRARRGGATRATSTSRATTAPRSTAAPRARAAKAPRAKTVARAAKVTEARATGATVEGLRCPVCGEGDLIVGRRAWGCARWREGCGFVVPFEFEGRAVTDAQLRDLVARGQTRSFAATVDGRAAKVRLRLDPSGRPPAVRRVDAT